VGGLIPPQADVGAPVVQFAYVRVDTQGLADASEGGEEVEEGAQVRKADAQPRDCPEAVRINRT